MIQERPTNSIRTLNFIMVCTGCLSFKWHITKCIKVADIKCAYMGRLTRLTSQFCFFFFCLFVFFSFCISVLQSCASMSGSKLKIAGVSPTLSKACSDFQTVFAPSSDAQQNSFPGNHWYRGPVRDSNPVTRYPWSEALTHEVIERMYMFIINGLHQHSIIKHFSKAKPKIKQLKILSNFIRFVPSFSVHWRTN